jgi:hypothetical protein
MTAPGLAGGISFFGRRDSFELTGRREWTLKAYQVFRKSLAEARNSFNVRSLCAV